MKRVLSLLRQVSVPSTAASEPLRGRDYMQAQAQIKIEVLGYHWYCLNDVVMGGQSTSSIERTDDGTLCFHGTINTHGGGFASCRTGDMGGGMEIPDATGVRIKMSAERHHCFKFTMAAGSVSSPALEELGAGMRPQMKRRWESMSEAQRSDVMKDMNWQCCIPEEVSEQKNDTVVEFFLPFSEFTPSLYGQRLTGLELDSSSIKHIGMNVGIFDANGKPDERFSSGPFKVVLHSVEFVCDDSDLETSSQAFTAGRY